MGLFGKGKKPQKGWVPAKEAADRAQKAHRKAEIRAALKGKGAAPAYKETGRGK